MRIEIQLRKMEISSQDEVPDVKTKRNVMVELNHSSPPPELYNSSTIKSRHRISITYYEEEGGRKREIGSADCHIVALLSDESVERIQKVYDIWATRGYNEVPLDVRVALENAISFGILPAISVAAEKARLPPPIPPVSLSPRPAQGEMKK